MIPRKRTRLSAMQRVEVWRRWKAGESLHAIGRALGKDHVVIRFLLARHGGIAPSARRRSRRVLTLVEREDISRGIASGCSMAGGVMVGWVSRTIFSGHLRADRIRIVALSIAIPSANNAGGVGRHQLAMNSRAASVPPTVIK